MPLTCCWVSHVLILKLPFGMGSVSSSLFLPPPTAAQSEQVSHWWDWWGVGFQQMWEVEVQVWLLVVGMLLVLLPGGKQLKCIETKAPCTSGWRHSCIGGLQHLLFGLLLYLCSWEWHRRKARARPAESMHHSELWFSWLLATTTITTIYTYNQAFCHAQRPAQNGNPGDREELWGSSTQDRGAEHGGSVGSSWSIIKEWSSEF